MYLLYKKELDEAIKAEQRRLISWINETVRLNPDVDLDSILSAADGYVSATAFEMTNKKIVSSPLAVETVVVPAVEVVEEPVVEEPTIEEVVEDVIETDAEADIVDDEVNGETIEEIVEHDAEAEAESVEEIAVEDVEGDVESDVTDYDTETTEHDVEEIVDVHTPHKYVPQHIPTVEELENIEKEDSLISFEQKHSSLPSREKEEAENKQIVYRKNHQAIFGNPDEIANL